MRDATEDAASGTGRRKRARRLGPEQRRPLILAAARAVFIENGYDGASMAAIAERAGVTKPVIYDSFANKDELFDALRDSERDRIMSVMVGALPESPQVDLEASVISALVALLRYVRSEPEAFRAIVFGEGASGEAALRIQQQRDGYIEMIAVMLEDWGRSPAERPRPEVELIAHTLVGAAEGVARAVMNDPDRFDPEASARLIGRFLTKGALGL